MTALQHPATTDAPALAPGTELMGQMEDSGFEETPYLARRADGQVVQLPHILYAVAERIDGEADYERIAAGATGAVGAELDPDDARFLVDEKLAPLGLIAGPAAQAAAEQRAEAKADEPKPGDDLLALTWKARVIPERASHAITSVFRPLFFGPVVLVIVAAFLALDRWLFFSHGIAQPVRALIYNPALLVVLFAGVVVATAFHEIGHATACRYGGAKPGVMGVGLYVIWPVFYTDVTSAYGLDRRGRLRTDLGGVYFNTIVALGCAGIYFATRWEPILVLVMVQTFAIVQQLLPLGRLDGYLILTDLTGVPDLLGRMKPILRSAVPGRAIADEVRELKPWVRRAATAYMVLLVPVLLLVFALMVIHAPRVFATAYDSFGVRWDNVTRAFGAGRLGTGMGNLLQCAALVLPGFGMVVSSGRIGKRVGAGAFSWSAGRPVRRAIVIGAAVAAASLAAFTWWPNGDYRPIQKGERGTVQAGLTSLKSIPTGRPSLTPVRARQLHGAPFERDARRARAASEDARQGAQAKSRSEETTTTDAPATTTTVSPTGTDTSPAEAPTAPSGTDTSTTTEPAPAPAPAPADSTTSPTPSDTTTSPTPTSTDTTTSTTPTSTDTTTSTTPTDTTTTPSTP